MNLFGKSIAVFGIIAALSFSAAAAEAAPAPQKGGQEQTESAGIERNLYNMGRGLVNVVTCWLEVPRCFIYHNSQVPVMGAVVGVCEGAGFTVVRAFAGVTDFISLGFMTDSIYESTHEFKEWVWSSRWIPKD